MRVIRNAEGYSHDYALFCNNSAALLRINASAAADRGLTVHLTSSRYLQSDVSSRTHVISTAIILTKQYLTPREVGYVLCDRAQIGRAHV